MGSGGSKANNGTTKASSLPKDLLNAIADEDYPMDPQSSSESSRKGSDASDTQLHSPIHETRQEHDITSLPAHQIDNQPQTVERFPSGGMGQNVRLGACIGKGSFGTVYVGFDDERGSFCAVKQYDLNENFDVSAVREEVALMSELNHPNIVSLIDWSQEGSTLNVYLEWVSGGSIAKCLKDRHKMPFKESVVCKYTRQILQALEYLHERDIVHRDIKGGNVMLSATGVIKLGDFGASKRLQALLKSPTRKIEGSPHWMAPEVITQKETGDGKASDIWSLACTVVEMATGDPPFSEFTGISAMFHIGSPDSFPAIPDDLSEDAQDFLNACFHRDPAKRPTASQLLRHPFVAPKTREALPPYMMTPAPVRPAPMYNAHQISYSGSPALRTRSASAAPPELQTYSNSSRRPSQEVVWRRSSHASPARASPLRNSTGVAPDEFTSNPVVTGDSSAVGPRRRRSARLSGGIAADSPARSSTSRSQSRPRTIWGRARSLSTSKFSPRWLRRRKTSSSTVTELRGATGVTPGARAVSPSPSARRGSSGSTTTTPRRFSRVREFFTRSRANSASESTATIGSSEGSMAHLHHGNSSVDPARMGWTEDSPPVGTRRATVSEGVSPMPAIHQAHGHGAHPPHQSAASAAAAAAAAALPPSTSPRFAHLASGFARRSTSVQSSPQLHTLPALQHSTSTTSIPASSASLPGSPLPYDQPGYSPRGSVINTRALEALPPIGGVSGYPSGAMNPRTSIASSPGAMWSSGVPSTGPPPSAVMSRHAGSMASLASVGRQVGEDPSPGTVVPAGVSPMSNRQRATLNGSVADAAKKLDFDGQEIASSVLLDESDVMEQPPSPGMDPGLEYHHAIHGRAPLSVVAPAAKVPLGAPVSGRSVSGSNVSSSTSMTPDSWSSSGRAFAVDLPPQSVPSSHATTTSKS